MHRNNTIHVLAEMIVPRLDQVKKIGRDRWKACCPAHDDKSPSFNFGISETGNILMKCWAGCSVESICSAVGVEMSSLFADSDLKPSRGPLQPTEDTFYIAVYKADYKRGYKPTDAERQRYLEAVARENNR